MANIQYYDVILKPVVTEKTMALMADKKYTFLVHTEANKTQIKEAVEKMFPGTKVAGVKTARTNTINVYDILKYNTVIATKAAVATIEEVYA